MNRKIEFSEEARKGLKKGADQLANAVKTTLGPKGRNVMITQGDFLPPHVTKDGVTVASHVFCEEELPDMGAQLLKLIAAKTNDEAGDGTTTATVLGQAIIKEGLKAVDSGANPQDLKKGMDLAVAKVVEDLKKQAKKVSGDDAIIKQVATVSANNDSDIGELIADAITRVGEEGVVTVEESHSHETTVDIVEGLQFDSGWQNRHYITNPKKMRAELDNPAVLICEDPLVTMQEIQGMLEVVSQQGKSILIIADDLEGEVNQALPINKQQGRLHVAAVKAPSLGDERTAILEDIAKITGAQIISKQRGNLIIGQPVRPDVLGSCKRAVVNRENTIISDGGGDEKIIKDHIKALKQQIKDEDNNTKLKQRLAKISGGVGVIRVGAQTEVEMREKKDRVDDALNATRAAIEEGIVPGGGTALIRAIKALETPVSTSEDVERGVVIIKNALVEPLAQIVNNTGGSPETVIAKVMEGKDGEGYNARDDKYEDLFKAGVIDPVKVTRIALENASSIGGMVVTTECVLYDKREGGDR